MENRAGGDIKYPIGEQDFKSLREGGYVYVDKTRFIYRLATGSGKYFFLARPRRFGKSLFLSSLRYFFEGERELFKGLDIDSSDWKWERYPVIYIDLNTDRYREGGKLGVVIDKYFEGWERDLGIDSPPADMSQRLKLIIERAHEVSGRQVVILVDEYDKPLVGNLNDTDVFDDYRLELASLYSNFKSSAEHIRMVFLTGVSRFSKLSIFSDLNNLKDISFDNSYAEICGITPSELKEYFAPGIRRLADKMHKSVERAEEMLRKNYDGYRFAAEGSDVYNPWSLLNCLDMQTIQYYWNDTGIPTLVAESLKRVHADLEKMFDTYCTEADLKGLDLENPQPLALLYQTGYLTIKSYSAKLRRYRVGIPNAEVKSGLFNVLLPYYVRTRRGTVNEVFNDIVVGFILGRPDDAMRSLQVYFAGIDYKMKIENENNFHNAFYLLTDLLGLETDTEVHTSDGSIDMVIRSDEYIYIIELKYDKSAEAAMRQIEEKEYALRYRNDSRTTYLIGASFSSRRRCIEDWIIRKL